MIRCLCLSALVLIKLLDEFIFTSVLSEMTSSFSSSKKKRIILAKKKKKKSTSLCTWNLREKKEKEEELYKWNKHFCLFT